MEKTANLWANPQPQHKNHPPHGISDGLKPKPCPTTHHETRSRDNPPGSKNKISVHYLFLTRICHSKKLPKISNVHNPCEDKRTPTLSGPQQIVPQTGPITCGKTRLKSQTTTHTTGRKTPMLKLKIIPQLAHFPHPLYNHVHLRPTPCTQRHPQHSIPTTTPTNPQFPERGLTMPTDTEETKSTPRKPSHTEFPQTRETKMELGSWALSYPHFNTNECPSLEITTNSQHLCS